MRSVRDIAGYLLGFVLFVVLVPALMWRMSGEVVLTFGRTAAFAILTILGIGLSVWSIVYMKGVGKGNPMDAFNHDLAPRTSVLMTDGPYAICRNPMLLGVIVYYVGVVVLLGSVGAACVLVAYALIMSVQVRFEERRLAEDFGAAYEGYCRRTKRLIPFVW